MTSTGRGAGGFGLATTLMIAAAIITMAFALAGASFNHLTISSHLCQRDQAANLAESAASAALAALLADPKFGNQGSAASRSVDISFAGEGSGRLTFDTVQAGQWRIPRSTNNLLSESPTTGYQRTVPAQTVQIIAQGRYHGAVRLLEAVVTIPPYRYAISSTGSIASSGGLQVLGVNDPALLAGGLQNLPPDEVEPGHIASNADSAQALQLNSSVGQPTLVTGDAQSCGSVVLGPATTVEGAVKNGADPAQVPEIQVSDYDPQGLGGLQTIPQSNYNAAVTVTGLTRRSGNLTVTSGGLSLDDGYLYVDGDLEVFGGLTGRGAIFCSGDLTVHGQSSFQADSVQALVVGGDVRLIGLGSSASTFQGIVYCRGDLEARNLTLVGALVGNRPDNQGGSSLQLQDINLVYSPQVLDFDFHPPTLRPSPLPPTVLPGGFSGITVLTEPSSNIDAADFYDSATDSYKSQLVTAQSAPMQFKVVGGPQTIVCQSLAELYTVYQQLGGSLTQAQMESNLQGIIQFRLDELSQQVAQLDILYQNTGHPSLATGHFNLDPNQFIALKDKMRKVLWRQL